MVSQIIVLIYIMSETDPGNVIPDPVNYNPDPVKLNPDSVMSTQIRKSLIRIR